MRASWRKASTKKLVSAHHPSVRSSYGRAMLLPVHAVLFALLVEFASEAGGALIVISGVGSGCFRVWAILTRKPADTIRWWTATGAVIGAGILILFVLVDLLVEGG